MGVDVSEKDLAERMAFLEFGQDDVARLGAVDDLARRYADGVIEDFYRHLLSFPDMRKSFFADPKTLERVKNLQREYFLRLTHGTYDLDYARDRVTIGAVHERIGLPIKSYLGMYNFYLRAVAMRLAEAHEADPGRALAAFLSLMKVTFLDMGLAIETYIDARERTIRRQEEAIQELPTPVLPVREGLLILPVIGLIDTRRARQLTEQLLGSIRANRAKVVVIDITGVQSVDSKVANHIVQTVDAARLMGTKVIIAGISPEVAQTMVTLGIDLARIATVGVLQTGIELAEKLLGYRVTRGEAVAEAVD